MLFTIVDFEKRERQDKLPMYVATLQCNEGDESAETFDEDGVLNDAALRSRVWRTTKVFFPPTEAQCEKLEKSVKVGETKVRCAIFREPAPQPFHIVKNDENGYYGTVKNSVVEVKKVVNGVEKIERVIEQTFVKNVYTDIVLTLFVDKNGNSTEGVPSELAKARFEQQVRDNLIELVTE